MPGKVRMILANTNEPMKHVVIYARVSSNTMEQLDSLKAQISGLTKFVFGHNNWKLVDIHINIASSKKGSVRPVFHKMIEECKAGLTDIVVVKNISRLGRDTVEVLDAINTLREMFDVVQEEKHKRSNVVVDENGTHRNTTKYSSKNNKRILT